MMMNPYYTCCLILPNVLCINLARQHHSENTIKRKLCSTSIEVYDINNKMRKYNNLFYLYLMSACHA